MNDQKDPQILFPHPWQIILLPNPVYWKSLFVGLTAPFLNLPLMTWELLAFPIIRGVIAIARFTLTAWIGGLTGRIIALPLPKPKLSFSVSDD